LESYDAVIVSCRKYAKSLSSAGFKGKVYQIYPHVDEQMHKGRVPTSMVGQFCEKFGIKGDDLVILVVARLDPIKGQDVAIKAMPSILKRFPTAKLVLAGDGSFSSSRRGGLGLPKGARWLDKLEGLAKRLGVGDNLIFTRYLTRDELRAAYSRANVVVLPSKLEGFGLVVIEGWLYKKPVVVSSRAGVAELVMDGENGYTFNPGEPGELASKIMTLFSKPERASEVGERGFQTAKTCFLEKSSALIWEVFQKVVT